MISAIVGATNDYRKEKKFLELTMVENKKKMIELIRGGKKVEVHVDNLVVGDLVKIRGGMEIAGDGILVIGNDVKIDESSMTGESKVLKKEVFPRCLIAREMAWAKEGAKENTSSVPSMVMLSGTKVSSGEGMYIVIAVGPNSAFGKIMDYLVAEQESKIQ